MPSTYAHYRFGQEVYRALPENIQKDIKPHLDLYQIGLHGPDILFYYKPLSVNRVNQLGFSLHDKPALRFFEHAQDIISEQQKSESCLAYIYGFICHFALDSECHGYIDEKIEESKITHTEIEVEFDRELMCMDGYEPITHSLTEHIRPSIENAGKIAAFFEGVTPKEVQRALESMIRYNRLLVAPHRMKRWLIYAMLGLSGNYKEMHGLLVNYKPNPGCADSTKRLKKLYDNAVFLAVRLIKEYSESIWGDKPLNTRYRLTFGSKEPEIEREGEHENKAYTA